ncbi:MAG: LytTR family DNA-binding domain-containing protein [Acidobacteria bacterium]|nr:LytTR family DNA-binding domain-containing protein [Acidobacteriota bacterium]MCI0628160.1 LytTR family DNA-binding domain-containing protein [Acidobacteriota bacterium]MCI0718815.1 LytTR family DNA-binding domain-containing protein [Acidobacteriota bacterium]
MEVTEPFPIKALIVDDEVLARNRLREILKKDAEIALVGECSSGEEAVQAILESAPDLLFLDVQMPEMDGFAVLEALPPERLPVVIFVTAYDQYALRAFEVYALDYILKPFDAERFRRTMRRAKTQIRQVRGSVLNEGLLSLLTELKEKPKPKHPERLVIKTGGRVSFLKTAEIDWIESEGNYVRLHVGKETHLLRETLNQMEERLDPDQFLRIHRSTIVNLDRIKELQPWFHGEYRVLLQDGTQLLLSRKYREKLRDLLGKAP